MDHRLFTPIFYRIDNELIQDEPEPFLIGTDTEIVLRKFQNNLILHQQIFVVRNSVVEHIQKPDFPDEIIVLRIFAPGIVKALLCILCDLLHLTHNFTCEIRTVVVAEKPDRGDRRLDLMDPLFNIFSVLVSLPSPVFDLLQHGPLRHL